MLKLRHWLLNEMQKPKPKPKERKDEQNINEINSFSVSQNFAQNECRVQHFKPKKAMFLTKIDITSN